MKRENKLSVQTCGNESLLLFNMPRVTKPVWFDYVVKFVLGSAIIGGYDFLE